VKDFRGGNDEQAGKAMRKADTLIKDLEKKKKALKAVEYTQEAKDDDGDDEDLPKTKTGLSFVCKEHLHHEHHTKDIVKMVPDSSLLRA